MGGVFIGEYLKNRRKELNLTLKEVAKKVGVSSSTVSRWETGNIANMRKDKISALAKVLKVDNQFILEGKEEINKNVIQNSDELTRYSTKTFDEFLEGLDYQKEMHISLILNKEDSELNTKTELVEIPEKAYKKLLNLFKTFK